MSLADHLRVIASNWWRILLISLIAGTASFAYSSSRPEVFEAGALLSVAGNDIIEGNLNEQQLVFRAEFYAEIAQSIRIATEAVKLAPLPIPATTARGRYDATTTETSGFISIRATGPTAETARKLVKGVGEALIQFVDDEQQAVRNQQVALLQQKIDALEVAIESVDTGSTDFRILDNQIAVTRAALIEVNTQDQFRIRAVTPPLANADPVAPRPSRDGMLGFLSALVLSAEGAVLLRAFSDRFARTNDAQVITEFTGLPVLAMIPRGRGPEVVEAFRTLRTNLMFLEGAGRPRTIAIVSPNPSSGKSFTAIHLSESAVAVDASVVLVDADLRRPVIHARVRVPREPGLSNALRGTSELSETLHSVEGMPSLKVLPSGSPVSDTVGVLGGRALRQILDALDTAELVVVDTPPGTVYADALAVAAQCDATLLVLDAKSTRRRAARQLIESLERTGATMIGVVVNNAQWNRRDSYDRS